VEYQQELVQEQEQVPVLVAEEQDCLVLLYSSFQSQTIP
jgi:hypothetical protein